MQNLILNHKDEIITNLIMQKNRLKDLSLLDKKSETQKAIKQLKQTIELIHQSK